jgi:hypothetical protein
MNGAGTLAGRVEGACFLSGSASPSLDSPRGCPYAVCLGLPSLRLPE